MTQEALKSYGKQEIQFTPPPVEIPQKKLEEMQAYAKELKRKFPHMKLHRLQRKVAEYFKVRFV